MSNTVTVSVGGYDFHVHYPLETKFYDVPGIYAFAKDDHNGKISLQYIGETDSFKTRLTPSHVKWTPAMRAGMNRILCYRPKDVNGNPVSQDRRREIQNDLIRQYNPPLNKQVLINI